MFALLLITAVLAGAILSWYLYLWKFVFLKNVPGPTPWPFIGNVPDIGMKTTDVIPAMMRMKNKYGGVVRLILGTRPGILVTDKEALKFFLTSTKMIHKSFAYHFLDGWLGEGLLTWHGEKWRKRRKLITPAYHFQILDKFVQVFNTVTDELVTKLRVESGDVKIGNLLKMQSLDIICETAMGVSVKSLANENQEYFNAVNAMCKIVMDRGFNPLQMYDSTYRLSENYQIEKKSLKILHNFTDSIIKQRRENLNGENAVENEDDTRKKFAFMDLLLKSTMDGEPLSNNDIREEVDTFMFAGHDTVAAALSFALYNLANHPEVQRKVFVEQLDIFGDDKTRHAETSDLNQMKYLELVIKEGLRMYPSVPIYARELEEDVYYDKLSTTLPKGLTIFIFAYGVHRDSMNFSDPDTFRPERFITDVDTIQKNPYGYLPFSAGPRNCIGQKFAMMEMKCTLSKIVRSFEILPPVSEIPFILSSETVLTTKNGIHVQFKPRI